MNPITLETWVKQGEKIFVLKGLIALEVPTGISKTVVDFSNSTRLVVFPNGDGQFVPFDSLANEGWTLQPSSPFDVPN